MSKKIQALSQGLQHIGFEVVHPFPLEVLNETCLEYLHCVLGRELPACGVLIGNTVSIWEYFISWLQQQPNWYDMKHPLDVFTEQSVQDCCNVVCPNAPVFWTHETQAYVVPIQKIAHESGCAFLSKGQLNIHPQYGPWFALRALLLLDETPPAKIEPRNPSSEATELKASQIFQQLCTQDNGSSEFLDIQSHWRGWLKLRDLYHVGKRYRYTEAQIKYHYTHDKEILKHEQGVPLA